MNGALCASPGTAGQRAQILLVCSEPSAADMVAAQAALHGLADITVAGGAEALDLLVRLDADLLVVDERPETKDGVQLLAAAARTFPGLVGILLASRQSGANVAQIDGLTVLRKPVDPGTLRSVCALALDCAALRRRVHGIDGEAGDGAHDRHAKPSLDDHGLESYEGLVARSASMRSVLATLREIEASDVTVLIQGETGTGKELVARAIHARSGRREGPFLPVNLGAISDNLRESELFGHVRGAFTGAHGTRGGLFLGADHGCLFLDEVGEASSALQVALLRVLEEGTIMPVGADRLRRVDVRIISATNQSLAQLVRQGRFRRDLYYRLNVFPVRLPPLRERVEDIFPLANHFLQSAARHLGRRPTGISHEARLALEAHPWEGNVRELRSVMERAALVCKGGLIVAADLPLGDDGDKAPASPSKIDLSPNGATLRDLEREILRKTLALADGNQSQAARMLGLHESTLRFRLRRAGIVPTRRAASS
jgi:DNA-binding NtrC family response regulator